MPGDYADAKGAPIVRSPSVDGRAQVLIWKILIIAEEKFWRLNAPELLEDTYVGKTFVDGVAVNAKKVNRGLAA
jgi:hypothetical protein